MKNPFKSKKVIAITCGVLSLLLLVCLVASGLGYYFGVYINLPEVVLKNSIDNFNNAKSIKADFITTYNVDYEGIKSLKNLKIDSKGSLEKSFESKLGIAKLSTFAVNLDSSVKNYSDSEVIYNQDTILYPYANTLKEAKIQRDGVDYVQMKRDGDYTTGDEFGFGIKGVLEDVDSFLANFINNDTKFENKSMDGDEYKYSTTLDFDKSKELFEKAISKPEKERYQRSFKTINYDINLTVNRSTRQITSFEIGTKNLVYTSTSDTQNIISTSSYDIKFENVNASKESISNSMPSGNSINYEDTARDISLLSGNSQAKINIAMITSYGELFTKRFANETYPQLKKDYIDTDKVSFTLYPSYSELSRSLNDGHPKEDYVAYLCSFEVNKEQSVMEYLMMNTDMSTRNASFYTTRISSLQGVDQDKFVKCHDSGKYNKTYDDLRNLFSDTTVFSGEPLFVISSIETGKSKLLSGAYPYQTFQDAINEVTSKTEVLQGVD